MLGRAGFLLLLAAGSLVAFSGALRPLDLRLLDTQFRLLREWFPETASHDVVVVGIDEETASLYPEPMALWHRHLGRFLSAMARAGPAALGIDIVLPDRDFESVVPGSHGALMKGLIEARRSFPLVLARTVDQSGAQRPVHLPYLKVLGGEGEGYALFPRDDDGIVRRFDERLGTKGEVTPTLVGQMARRLALEPGHGLIDYRVGSAFEYVRFHQVLRWFDDQNTAALAGAFRGKPVLLGMVLRFEDRQAAPVPLAGWEPRESSVPGVLLHAQALRNLLGGGLIQPAPAAAIAALAGAAGLLWFVSASTALTVAAAIAAAGLLLAASTWLLTQGWFVPVVAPALVAGAALFGRHGYETFLKLRERRRLRASFSGYVSPGIMDEILAGRLRPELGGERAFVCVMFSDIRGYTTRSEAMTPEQVISFLNRYFEQVVGVIHERGGSVVSFMGDGIMAVFGGPKPLENPCAAAFEAARGMLRYVAELNRQFAAEGVVPVDIGVGLNAGTAVLGHIGASTRHDYSAIGDVTNVASRVEGLTKEAGYRVVLTRAVADRLGAPAQLVPLGMMAIKGHTPVEVYGYDRV